MNFYEQKTGQDQTPLYLYPASYARDNWQLEEYRASRNACMACKEAIESALAEHYYNNRLNPGAVSKVLEKFRPKQVTYVLACTIQHGHVPYEFVLWPLPMLHVLLTERIIIYGKGNWN